MISGIFQTVNHPDFCPLASTTIKSSKANEITDPVTALITVMVIVLAIVMVSSNDCPASVMSFIMVTVLVTVTVIVVVIVMMMSGDCPGCCHCDVK